MTNKINLTFTAFLFVTSISAQASNAGNEEYNIDGCVASTHRNVTQITNTAVQNVEQCVDVTGRSVTTVTQNVEQCMDVTDRCVNTVGPVLGIAHRFLQFVGLL